MQYKALVLAALSAAAALPGARKAHHHHRRHAEAEADANYENVNWAEALAGIDWATVKYDSTTAAPQAAVVGTTTVAVVAAAAATTAQRTTLATQAASSSAAVAAGNVVQKAQAVVSSIVAAVTPASTTSAAAAATTSAASSTSDSKTASSSEYNVNVINNCAHTIWQAGWQTNTAGGLISSEVKGNEMSAGANLNLVIPKSAMGVQIWARTGCTGSGSSFTCSVGDCQGYECSSIIWQGGPIMAEFGSGLNTDQYNTGITAYDISAIPGNNVGVKIVPSISSCETKYCPVSGCSTDQAWLSASDMDLGSPADTTCSDSANFTVTFCPA